MQKFERRECPVHGPSDCRATYADETHGEPARTLVLLECLTCEREPLRLDATDPRPVQPYARRTLAPQSRYQPDWDRER